MDAFSKIADAIEGSKDAWQQAPLYYCFEPWGVTERSKLVLDQAIRDSVDLFSDDLMRCVGRPPHPFQDGFLLSTKFFRGVFASNQVGKSLGVFVDVVASATGEIPFSMRYPKGHDTGIPRPINRPNILRWGRRDRESGEVIDFNPRAKPDDSWNCGNVIGVGVFPAEKIVPPGSSIRIASYQKNILENWWPSFTGRKRDGMGAFMPHDLIDRNKGSHGLRGFNKQDYQCFLKRGVVLQFLTYESGAEKFEGIKVPTYLDEEPPSEDIVGAVVTHTSRWVLIETPIFGITHTRDLIFPKRPTADQDTFHATAYDCPYLTAREIEQQRSIIGGKEWELGARLWGVPTEQAGKPFYDRTKINFWIQRFRMPYRLVSFQPTREWDGIKSNPRISRLPGLMDTPIRMVECGEDDQRTVWKLYEDREDGVGYVSASDQAEGAETPDAAGDLSTDVIGRPSEDNPLRPVICATLRSTLPTPQFARESLYAARYFNNALLAPEMGKGAANEAYKMVASDWPWWFMDTITRQSTRKQVEYRGFCPTSDRRDAIYETLIRDWLDEYEIDQYPDIPDEWILREAAGAIVGKTRGGAARCDHPLSGTLDSLTAFGILLFVHQKEFVRQIKSRGGPNKAAPRETWLERALKKRNPKDVVFLGEGVHSFR